jgi:aspartate racemase
MNPTPREPAGRSCGHSIWKRVIGIVGGLGPYAHVEFERLILSAVSQRQGHLLCDQQYPEWMLSSVPGTPDRTEALLGKAASPVANLELSLRRLCGTPTAPGADFAVIACISAHAYLDELRSRVELPLLDVVAETMAAASRRLPNGGRVGVLATTGAIRAGLFPAAAANCDQRLTTVSLLDLPGNGADPGHFQEELVMRTIYGDWVNGRRAGGIKSGLATAQQREAAAERLAAAVRLLGSMGADLVVLACSELPLALPDSSLDGIPLVNALQVAAEACIEIALGERPLPAMPWLSARS